MRAARLVTSRSSRRRGRVKPTTKPATPARSSDRGRSHERADRGRAHHGDRERLAELAHSVLVRRAIDLARPGASRRASLSSPRCGPDRRDPSDHGDQRRAEQARQHAAGQAASSPERSAHRGGRASSATSTAYGRTRAAETRRRRHDEARPAAPRRSRRRSLRADRASSRRSLVKMRASIGSRPRRPSTTTPIAVRTPATTSVTHAAARPVEVAKRARARRQRDENQPRQHDDGLAR